MQQFIQQQHEILQALATALNIKDILDIAIVTIVIYLFLLFIKQTRSFFIFTAVTLLVAVGYLSHSFNLSLTRQLLDPILTFVLVILVIVFQPELRRFIRWIASQRRILEKKIAATENTIDTLVDVIEDMAEKRIGAIFVFQGESYLDDIIQGGVSLDAKISAPLILSIFDTSSPGHDGAVLIDKNRVRRFGLHLPLADEFKGFTKMGTRHRAAAGITEKSDALAVVVSEEKGTISIAQNGSLTTVHDREGLCHELDEFLKINISTPFGGSFWRYFFIKNFYIKIFSLATAVVLWVLIVYQTGVVNKEISVPIEFRHVPQELSLASSTVSTINLTIAGSNNDIASLTPENIRVVVSLQDAKVGNNKITIDNHEIVIPNYVSVVSVEPESVNITLQEAQK